MYITPTSPMLTPTHFSALGEEEAADICMSFSAYEIFAYFGAWTARVECGMYGIRAYT